MRQAPCGVRWTSNDGSRTDFREATMPVITFANTKGGAGKTTAVLLLSTELARLGYRVTILDSDPQRWITRWYETSDAPDNLKVIPYINASNIQTHLRDNKPDTDYFIVDLP